MPARKRARSAEDRLDWQAARQIWSELYGIDPHDREALLGLLRALRHLGRLDDAGAVSGLASDEHAGHIDFALSVAETARLRAPSADRVARNLQVLRRFPDFVSGYAACAVLLLAADCIEQAAEILRAGNACFGAAFERLRPDIGRLIPELHPAIAREDWSAAASAVARSVGRARPASGEFLGGIAELEAMFEAAIGGTVAAPAPELRAAVTAPPRPRPAISQKPPVSTPAASLRRPSQDAGRGTDRPAHDRPARGARPGRRTGRVVAVGMAGAGLMGLAAGVAVLVPRAEPAASHEAAMAPVPRAIPPVGAKTARIAVATPFSRPRVRPVSVHPTIPATILARAPLPADEPIHVTLRYGSGDAGAVADAAQIAALLRSQGMLADGPIALGRPAGRSGVGYFFAQDRAAADRLAQRLFAGSAVSDPPRDDCRTAAPAGRDFHHDRCGTPPCPAIPSVRKADMTPSILHGTALALALLITAGAASAQGAPTAGKAPDALDLYFDTGSATIRPQDMKLLDQASRLYSEGKPIVMIVSGSADLVGPPGLNLQLSQARADNVVRGLVERGIPVERFQVLAKGVSDLPVATGTDVVEPRNRRVEITWR